ncbi:MAG: hypothetical protein NC120_09360 [Ruminococcus sp.]|nr:hypothetical protein [Ruminococcus sp.]
MSNLSDKYIKALDSLEISPDFKERTAKMMKELRDNGDTLVISDDCESEYEADKITVSLSREKNNGRGGRIGFYRIASAAAAAAACFAIAVSVNRAGVFDSGIDSAERTGSAALDSIDDRSYVNAPTDTSGGAPEEDIPEVQAETPVTEDFPADTAEEAQTASPTVSEYEPYTVSPRKEGGSLGSGSMNTGAAQTETPADGKNGEEASEAPQQQVIAVSPPMGREDTDADEVYDEESEQEFPLYEAQYDPPAGAGAFDENSGNVDDESQQVTAVSQISKAADFSAESIISVFRPSDSEAVITPLTGSFPEGTAPARIKGRKEIRSLEDDLIGFTEEREAKLISSVPTDSRYIIDFSDSRGNTMRIYVGISKYICYSHQGNLFGFELTEEEYSALDGYFIGLLTAD